MLSHGTRSTYQREHCRCTPCKAANAAYEAKYRTAKRKGQTLPGALVGAAETWRQLRLLRTEYETQRALATRLGLVDRHLQFNRQRVTVRTAVKVRHRYELDILAGLDTSAFENNQSV